MSITRQVTVWCDRCSRWEQATATAPQLRRELKEYGWTRHGSRDLCPACSSCEGTGREEERKTHVTST